MTVSRRAFAHFCLAVAAAVAGIDACAQGYPAKPIRLVVGVPAGSGADLSARRIADLLAHELGGTVYVDNRPGADGVIAVGQVTAAPPDGYTLLFGLSSQMTINPATIANLAYDPQRDLAPVSLIAYQPTVFAVHPTLPVTSVAELVDYTRKHPASVNYGTGTSAFMIAAEAFKLRTGTDMQNIPFNGAGAALNALVAGTVQAAVVPLPGAFAAAQAGRIRAIAVSGSRRVPQLPDVPSFAEAKLVDDVPVFTALYAPAGTPKPLVDALHAALVRAFASPAARERGEQAGDIVAVTTPDELRAVVARDLVRIGDVVKKIGLSR